MAKFIQEFINLYPRKNTQKVYIAGIHRYIEIMYGIKKNGTKITDQEKQEYELLANEYFKSEQRNYYEDMLKFVTSLADSPPMTARTYFGAMKEFFAHNGIEFNSREIKSFRNKMPKGHARTVELELDNTRIHKIMEHMDVKGKALILTLASSGMRIGESLCITLGEMDIDATPPTITVRGENTKTGNQRFVFISKEAKVTIQEWLKVRNEYIESAQNRNNGFVKCGIGTKKSTDDDRLFPFSDNVAQQIWTNAVANAKMTSMDKGTGRSQLRIHQLRKFFRSQLAIGCPVDIVEALMGHEGYLTGAYRRFSRSQMAEYYLKNEHLLYITMPKDIQKIESEFKEELNTNRKLIQDIVLENHELKQKLTQQSNQLIQLENTMNHIVDALKEGKSPDNLFFDNNSKKIVVKPPLK
jgi:integrase